MLTYDILDDKAFHIGVISDTHGLLRPEAVNALYGSNLILHAGDIGDPEIINKLESIAPVAAIRGNVDTPPSLFKFPVSETIQAGTIKIFMIHNIADLNFAPEEKGIAVVVYGHSHKAFMERRNGVLYFNPGSAGKKRFNLPLGTGMITISKGTLHGKFLEFPFL